MGAEIRGLAVLGIVCGTAVASDEMSMCEGTPSDIACRYKELETARTAFQKSGDTGKQLPSRDRGDILRSRGITHRA
ncbi:hypothetical protein K466DRAFT_260580 [Polyporus arcularius HHB13444]|uniref:Uncharacterized protein n=1 Tax=Polyporus arcularius HHB13444 TaxID=1314778 RepID=A0A5C3PUJ0_9APHY|nr:hypothetical protein K466DRAFT_260580 [Polyporus arcularius HHB13444]